jgi:hypothetical protein
LNKPKRAAIKGNSKRAVSLYRDALFFLDREDVRTEERDAIAGKINSRLNRCASCRRKKKSKRKVRKIKK